MGMSSLHIFTDGLHCILPVEFIPYYSGIPNNFQDLLSVCPVVVLLLL